MFSSYYNDSPPPWIVTDLAPVTLATTAKALYTPSAFPNFGGQFWSTFGRRVKIRLAGKITTVLTPGNGSFNVYYGTGADANGVAIMTGTPVALSASQTNLTWEAEINVRAVTLGASGTLQCMGRAHFNNAVIASTLQPILLPASAAAPSAACDLTAALIISVQYLRSGSTAETMTVQDMEVIVRN